MVDSTWNRLSLMIKQGDLNSTDRCNLLLNSGCDSLNMDIGCITRIDHECMEIIYSTKKPLRGAEFPLGQTLCQFTVEHGDVLTSPDLRDTNWQEFGVIPPFQFGSYVGLPIIIHNQLFGTLFFASYTPRQADFTEREEAFLMMMVSSLRGIIHTELLKR